MKSTCKDVMPYLMRKVFCRDNEKYFPQTLREEVVCFEFQGVMLHALYKFKDHQPDLLESLLIIYIYVCYTDLVWEKIQPDAISIK